MRLNLGCGNWRLWEWQNVDIPGVDLRVYPWPWANYTVDEILASHILEHFDREAGYAFLKECYRVLKPGGVLHLAVPDMDKFIDCRLAGDYSQIGNYPQQDLNLLLGGDEDADSPQAHRYMYCYASLAYTLNEVGFGQVERRDGPRDFDSPVYVPISLYVDAVR